MLYGNYLFTCRLESDALLPGYKGSTFRGVFGHALKRVVCALKRQTCDDCPLKNRCVYAMVFETPVAVPLPENSRISEPPHPFVIEPPLTDTRQYRKGEKIECGMILFGEPNNSLSYFIYAFEQMGKIGIGRRVNGNRGRFFLESVRTSDREIYSWKDRTFVQDETPGTLTMDAAASSDNSNGPSRVSLNLETPLRLKFKNQVRASLPFHVLVRAMLRRVSSLSAIWDGVEPALDYKGLVQRAEKVHIQKNNLRWFDWKRYSNRQERKMFMGGLVGNVTYEGNLEEFMPLLQFSEKVHLGKNTSFGLGKVKLGFNPLFEGDRKGRNL